VPSPSDRNSCTYPAHTIRERTTLNAKAARAVDAVHRWCITGTPVQNRISDIGGLVHFLRIHPYDDARKFEMELIRPWREKPSEESLQRLQTLMGSIALHRTRQVIDLPPLTEEVRKVDFDMEELDEYKKARDGALGVLHQTLNSGSAPSTTYINALQRINDMRRICSHGILLRHSTKPSTQSSASMESAVTEDCSRDDTAQTGSTTSTTSSALATPITTTTEHELDQLLGATTDPRCPSCCSQISEDAELEVDDVPFMADDFTTVSTTEKGPPVSQCTECARMTATSPRSSTPESSPKSLLGEVDTEDCNEQRSFPSKHSAVASYIQSLPPEDKWQVVFPQPSSMHLMSLSVVFSFWTTTLAVMRDALVHVGIGCCAYQGLMPYASRTRTLKKFKEDANVRVILASITCGGQG